MFAKSTVHFEACAGVFAGMIAEKAAGEPLMTFLQRRIFAPLGIKAIDQDKAVGKGFPVGYHRNALGPVRAAPPPASTSRPIAAP